MRIAILLISNGDRDFSSEIEAAVKDVIKLDSSGHSFTELLTQIIEQPGCESALTIQSQNHRLYFLNDVFCARLKIRPHAYLSGFSVAGSLSKAQQQALAQAGRSSEQVAVHTPEINPKTSELDCFIDSIKLIASRTKISSDGAENYWFMPRHQPRILQLNLNREHSAGSLVLVQGSGVLHAKPLIHERQLFFVISGSSIDDIINKTRLLDKDIRRQSQSSPRGFWENCFKYYRSAHKLALVLQATGIEQLQQEIQRFLPAAELNQQQLKWHWQTPGGSCFFAGYDHVHTGLTFVYPGAGTSYNNMLSSLHLYFPALYQNLEKKLDLGAALQADHFYADAAEKPNLSQLAISGAGTSYLLSQLLVNEFKLKPEFALGYSMGEAAMWASLGVWQHPESLIEKTAGSEIFNTEISGELKAVRRLWQLDSNEPINWNSFVVRCPAEKIEALLDEYPKAYLAITQGDTCVLAGDEQQCRQLLNHLGKHGIASNMVTAMHTPAAAEVYGALKTFYQLPLQLNSPAINFISAGCEQVMRQPGSQAIARSIARAFTERLDFSGVIKKAVNNGGRIFLEVGADRQTAGIIDKLTKRNDDIHSLAINSKAQPAITGLLKCIARLISLRVPMSLEPLMPGNIKKN